jgi:hypothetical protein
MLILKKVSQTVNYSEVEFVGMTLERNGIFGDLNDAVMDFGIIFHPGAHILSCCHYECRFWIKSLPFNPAYLSC